MDNQRPHGEESNAQPASSPCKKLRYTDPDLSVIVKCNEDAEPKIYQMYAQNLARLSTFVDTSLSVDMREKNDMEITFYNITPDGFEKALLFLQDPLAVRTMTPTDAMELVPFYDQYQFPGGLLLCDEILSDYIGEQAAVMTTKPPDDLDVLVQISTLAYKYNLVKSRPRSISYLNIRFQSDRSSVFGPTMFSENHMRLLQPMFQEGLLLLPDGFTKEDLESSLFPKYFVKCMACDYATKMTQYITLQGTGTHDGKFRQEGENRYIAPFREEVVQLRNGGLVNAYLIIAKSELCGNDWAILCSRVLGGQIPHVLWKCPYSKNLTLPPSDPWIPVDTAAVNRTVKIKYN